MAREVNGAGWPGQRGWAIDYNADQEQVVDYVYIEADANLIAAAPDLLEALETARDYVYSALVDRKAAFAGYPDKWRQEAEDLEAIDAVIAKATITDAAHRAQGERK